MKRRLLVIDCETGGFDPKVHALLSIAAIVVHDGAIEDLFYSLVFPEGEIEEQAIAVNGITEEQLLHAPSAISVVNAIEAMLQKHDMRDRVTLAGHNTAFDRGFLGKLWGQVRDDFESRFSHRMICTQTGALMLEQAGKLSLPGGSASLEALCNLWHIQRGNAHNALDDATATVHVLKKELQLMGGR